MKLCIVQTRPHRGQLEENLNAHLLWVAKAAALGAEVVVFPELSLTGYEPEMAERLALEEDSSFFEPLAKQAELHRLSIAAGLPLQTTNGLCIATLCFHPGGFREVYTKQSLHPDEKAFFVEHSSHNGLFFDKERFALAICYEISRPEHIQKAMKHAPLMYVASVAKTAKGVEQASERLSEIAEKHSLYTMMSNSVGMCEDGLCAGGSAIWDREGKLLAALNAEAEGCLLLDSKTGDVLSLSAET